MNVPVVSRSFCQVFLFRWSMILSASLIHTLRVILHWCYGNGRYYILAYVVIRADVVAKAGAGRC